MSVARVPHCDPLVLHEKGRCVYCDGFPGLQEQRIASGTNFTGEGDPLKNPCPSEVERDLEKIERWPGNRAVSRDYYMGGVE